MRPDQISELFEDLKKLSMKYGLVIYLPSSSGPLNLSNTVVDSLTLKYAEVDVSTKVVIPTKIVLHKSRKRIQK